MRSLLFMFLVSSLAPSCTLSRSGQSSDATKGEGQAAPGAPLITPVGRVNSTPDAVWFQWSEQVVERSGPANTAAIALTPHEPGTLEYINPHTLVFRPSEGFRAGTDYTLTMTPGADETKGGMKPGPWSHNFTTPQFRLLGMEPHGVDYRRRRVEVTLYFSGTVQLASLRTESEWTLNGEKIVRRPSYDLSRDRRAVKVSVPLDTFKASDTLALSMGSAVMHRDGVTAPAAEVAVKIGEVPKLEILQAVARRSSTSTVIDVYCKDFAAGRTTSVWDSDLREWLYPTPSCEPDPGSITAALRISPALPFRVSARRGGFRLHGEFTKGQYTLLFSKGLKTTVGGTLGDDVKVSVTVSPHKPKVSFISQGRYLPPSAWTSLPINHVNTSSVTLTVRHIPKSNLVFWLSGWSEQASTRESDHIKTVEIPLRNQEDRTYTSWLDIRSHLPDPESGVYELSLIGPSTSTTRRLLLTNLNLVAKRAARPAGKQWSHEVWAWAIDAHTNRPRKGVRLELVRPSGHVLTSCLTGSTGGCVLKAPSGDPDPSPPFAIIATKGRDFTYLKYSDLKTQNPDDATYGRSYSNSTPYRATVYSDRGVYRPGETVHVAGILRTDAHVAPAAGIPTVIKLLDPKRKTQKKITLTTNAAGMIAADFAIPSHAPTGRYHVTLNFGGEELKEYGFLVETIVPERMKVSARLQHQSVRRPRDASVDIDARYLFGGSAAGSLVDLSCDLRATPFRPEKFSQYHFGRRGVEDGTSLGASKTSSKMPARGALRLACAEMEEFALLDTAGVLDINVAIHEAGSGRVSRAQAKSRVLPFDRYAGVKTDAKLAKAGSPFVVDLVITDKQGEASSSTHEVMVEMLSLHSTYNRSFDRRSGTSRATSEFREVKEGVRKVKVTNGRAKLRVTPASNGDLFMVRVRLGDAVTELAIPGEQPDYYWGWGDSGRSRSETPEPSRPVNVKVSGPASVDVDQDFDVPFISPYRGRALVTIESDRVLQARWIDVKAGRNVYTARVKEFTENIYASVLVAKDPHLESKRSLIPERAFGVTSVRVRPKQYETALKVEAPALAKPHETVNVKIDAGESNRSRFLTLAVVDEGLLQLTRFVSPAPIRSLFSRRSLGVDTFDTIGWALQIPDSRARSTRGGGGDLGKGGLHPVKPVAIWTGLLEVPKDGKLTVPVSIPQYRGKLRLMAVIAGPTRVGSAEARLTVRDPLVLQATMPRFLSDGDTFQVPVFLTNMTGADASVTVRVSAQSAIADNGQSAPPLVDFTGQTETTLQLDKGKAGVALFHGVTKSQTGRVRLKVEARANGIHVFDTLEVPLQPLGPMAREVSFVPFPVRSELKLEDHLGDWQRGTGNTTFWVTQAQFAEVYNHLSFLVKYPYGCLEQTTSGTRPLLFASDHFERVAPRLASKGGGVSEMIQAGIERVLSMQTPSGGLGYWPGARSPSRWASAYATHMLLDAKDRGYEVPKARLKAVLEWMQRDVSGRAGQSSSAAANGYSHYVLARAGSASRAIIEKDLAAIPSPAPAHLIESQYLLKAALFLTGDRRFESDLRALNQWQKDPGRDLDGSFFSVRRGRAMLLSVFLNLFGAEPSARQQVSEVAAEISDASRRYNTQELAWAVTAISRWNQAPADGLAQPTVTVNGASVSPSSRSKSSGTTWSISGLSKRDTVRLISSSGQERQLSLIVISEGVREDAALSRSNGGLEVARAWLTPEGQPIVNDGVKLGDIIYSTVKVTNTTPRSVQNIALVDRFPAGLEVENPRLGHGSRPAWTKTSANWDLEHMNIRDDRIEVFGRLGPGETRQVVYALRAVTAGRFQSPPVIAEAMYNPDMYASLSGPQILIGSPPLVETP